MIMTAMLLALAFSDAALGAAEIRDFRLRDEPLTTTDATIKVRAWTPGVNGWTRAPDHECPAFFQNDVSGIGLVRIGPPCEDEEIPYAL